MDATTKLEKKGDVRVVKFSDGHVAITVRGERSTVTLKGYASKDQLIEELLAFCAAWPDHPPRVSPPNHRK
jgi:hypothetical protein